MNHLLVIFAIGAALAPAHALAQDAPVDSLALARQYTEWLYAGEADSLLAHSSDETRKETGAKDRFTSMSGMIAERAGFELEVSEETWKLRNGDCQYWRTAQFSAMEEPLLVRWVLDSLGRIEGYGVGPFTQAPVVESETCSTGTS
ncbi:MAG TPA: hypothetical protein VEY33_13880 [Gemmatimonadota bacterium]|nr:hypothetical protein [Gemmatimonadota bacterium]